MLTGNRKKVNILIVLSLMTIIVWIFVFKESRQTNALEVVFFDIGQGDSIFIETPDKEQILIDGGPDSSILEKLGNQMDFYDRYIDLVILTHPEYDHINGLIEVIKRYEIGAIIANGVVRDTDAYNEWVDVIEQKNIPVYIAKLGGQVDFGDDIVLNILYPFESLSGQEVSDVNNSSVVGKLIYKDFEILLTGDIESSIEKKLVNSGLNLEADVLKVAHHGSKTSSTEDFLKAVNPKLNVIQAGENNKYGHPHQEVLDRMAMVVTLVTGNDGDVKVLSGGRGIAFFPRTDVLPRTN